MLAGWLDSLTAWIWKILLLLVEAALDIIGDSFIRGFQMITSVILYVLSKMPLPEFMRDSSIGAVLAQGGGTVLWAAEVFQLGPSMIVIGIAIVFYLLRRVLTIGIW